MNTINMIIVRIGLAGMLYFLFTGQEELAVLISPMVLFAMLSLWARKKIKEMEDVEITEESDLPPTSPLQSFIEISGGKTCPPHPWVREEATDRLFCAKCGQFPGIE